ncbi:MAG: hypothetical protein IKZ87_09260 [Actinomycetaceae bacterium]|nr:hypothetical protein [Actinomycetaceae bacterium]
MPFILAIGILFVLLVAAVRVGDFFVRLFTEPIALFWDMLDVVARLLSGVVGLVVIAALLAFFAQDDKGLALGFLLYLGAPFLVLAVLFRLLVNWHNNRTY